VTSKDIANQDNAQECECKAEKVIFLPCSGASNCGQIANQAAVKLTQEGLGNMYCLAGIGAHIEGMVESARSADRLVILDGCPTACSKKTVEHAGLVVTDWLCVTHEGIDKVHGFDISAEEVALIAQRAKEALLNTKASRTIGR